MSDVKKIPEEIADYLSYDAKTGSLTWIKPSGKKILTGSSAGTITLTGYRKVRFKGSSYFAHRVAWFLYYCNQPKEIDHINHDRLDNRISNLREVSRKENLRNKGLTKINRSGTMGVRWDKDRNRWRSSIKIDGKLIHLGRYLKKIDAIAARKAAEIKYGFHENHGTGHAVGR